MTVILFLFLTFLLIGFVSKLSLMNSFMYIAISLCWGIVCYFLTRWVMQHPLSSVEDWSTSLHDSIGCLLWVDVAIDMIACVKLAVGRSSPRLSWMRYWPKPSLLFSLYVFITWLMRYSYLLPLSVWPLGIGMGCAILLVVLVWGYQRILPVSAARWESLYHSNIVCILLFVILNGMMN